MSAVESHFIGVIIVVLMLVFVGIWIWAWLPHHKMDFDSLARMPMLDVPPAQRDDGPIAKEDIT